MVIYFLPLFSRWFSSSSGTQTQTLKVDFAADDDADDNADSGDADNHNDGDDGDGDGGDGGDGDDDDDDDDGGGDGDDNDQNCSGRLCFHTAFHDDNAPPCPPRWPTIKWYHGQDGDCDNDHLRDEYQALQDAQWRNVWTHSESESERMMSPGNLWKQGELLSSRITSPILVLPLKSMSQGALM